MNARSLAMTAAAAVAATTLLTGVAFATTNASGTADTDTDDHGSAISTLAKTTTMTGEAKGDAISAAAKATAETKDADEAKDADETKDADEAKDTDKDTDADRDGHGDAIATLAKATTPGTGHGATVSAAARKGHDTH